MFRFFVEELIEIRESVQYLHRQIKNMEVKLDHCDFIHDTEGTKRKRRKATDLERKYVVSMHI